MRAFRTLLAAGLGVSMLVTPTIAAAQSDMVPDPATIPLALEPHGRLPLEGTPWRLEGYVRGDRAGAPGPEVAAFIEFGPRFYAGSGGCSRIEGRFGVNGAALTFQPKTFDERSCAENLTLVQQAVESGLRRAAAYRIEPGETSSEDKLVIYSVTGAEVLRYGLDDLALLDGGEWRLDAYTVGGETVRPSDEAPGLLTFRPETDAVYKRRQSGPLTGSSGCNGIVAEFYRRADVLSFSELQITDAPCGPELADQQAAIIDVLDSTAIRLDLPADRLILTSADTGERLELVSQSPLEGTTWWLQRTTADGGIGDQRVTLRLEDGLAVGDGPCGRFSATYVTDGRFITFSDARGARDGTCDELRTEQALISGLRRSVRIDRGVERLAFEDAYGSDQLVFSRPFAP